MARINWEKSNTATRQRCIDAYIGLTPKAKFRRRRYGLTAANLKQRGNDTTRYDCRGLLKCAQRLTFGL